MHELTALTALILLTGACQSHSSSRRVDAAPSAPAISDLDQRKMTKGVAAKMTDWSALTDPDRLRIASLVLRVRSLGVAGADKYAWARVQVLATIKNTSGMQIESELQIAYYAGKPGVPSGDSTVYLEPYSDAANHPWKLLGGSAQQGVSHAGTP